MFNVLLDRQIEYLFYFYVLREYIRTFPRHELSPVYCTPVLLLYNIGVQMVILVEPAIVTQCRHVG